MGNTTQEGPADGREPPQDAGIERVIVADGDRISVEEASSFVSVSDRIAIGEHEMRRYVAFAVVATFAIVNLAVFGLLIWLDFRDLALIAEGKLEATRRLLSTELLMTVVGAATVQLGAIAYIVATYLFPTSAPSDHSR
jgi:hypothetical protein